MEAPHIEKIKELNADCYYVCIQLEFEDEYYKKQAGVNLINVDFGDKIKMSGFSMMQTFNISRT